MRNGVEGVCIEHGRGVKHAENWRGILKERAHIEDININRKVKVHLSLCTIFSHIEGVDICRLLL
jgi:hypothetical protein